VHVGDLIFFYGSLRPPFDTQRRIGIVSMVRHLGPARVRGALHDLGAYPALTVGTGIVAGDLYEIIDGRLADVLDPFEGFDPTNHAASRYIRERVDLVTPAGIAWVYRHRRTLGSSPIVASGDWVAHLRRAGRDGTLGPDGGPGLPG
jgi:gamma-glutamylcyclotransferase (GGCT)/AIG2-like uncharacterized protein YtfP